MIHILIVDDKEENRYYLEALLKGCGCETETANHGAEALIKARMHPPHMVVSDLLMPVMDGYTLLRHWKSDPRLQAIPFIVYTATYTEAEDEQLALSLGADAFILKPAEPEDFLAKMREVHARPAAGTARPPVTSAAEEAGILKVYNETLIRKLEQKTMQLEATNRVLQEDIARSREMESSLRTSRQQFSSAFENAGIGVALVSPEGRFLKVNQSLTRMLGYEGEELLDRGFQSLTHPDDLEKDLELARELLAGERQAYQIEKRYIHKDAHLVWALLSVSLVRDDEGQPVHFISQIQDITERFDARSELLHRTSLLHAVADSTPDAVFVKDGKGRYLLFNEAAARFVGRPVKEILGRDDTAIYGAEEARVIMERDRAVLESGTVSTTEEILTAAGVTRTYLATRAPWRDSRGNVIGITGISCDITDRKRTENKIREQAALLDQAQDAILVQDLQHRILYWNRGAERLYGWTSEAAAGQPLDQLLPMDVEIFEEATRTVLREGEWVGELQQENRQGRKLTIEARWTLLRAEGDQAKSVLAIHKDITERRVMEQHLLRAQRMESIGTLAGGIAHDLNNVLTPIMMSIGLLRSEEADPDRIAVLDTIEGSARRGADMVRQVLNFARGVEGRKMVISIPLLLQEVAGIMNETFLKSITITSEAPEDLWPVIGDPTQLHQVLLNLGVNGRDAMPRGGTLSLKASNVEWDEPIAGVDPEARPGPHVVIEVTDTGSGMAPEVVERIFDPFFTTKELGQGTGLGLSTSLAIVKSHGGFLRVTSLPGVGTSFQVHLPAHSGPPGELVDSAKPAIPRGHGQWILVIDDEAAVRQITRQTLEMYGYRVLLAADGADAAVLYAARQQEIAAVLTDMMMPVMDGPATIGVLLRINPAVRIIAASGLNEESMVSRAVTAGVRHFLPKPYTAETLLLILDQVLRSR